MIAFLLQVRAYLIEKNSVEIILRIIYLGKMLPADPETDKDFLNDFFSSGS